MSGYGIAGTGTALYFSTGNSDPTTYDGTTNIQESVVTLSNQLRLLGTFTPSKWPPWMKAMGILDPEGCSYYHPKAENFRISLSRRAKTEDCFCSIATPCKRQASTRPQPSTHISFRVAGADRHFLRAPMGLVVL